jgi:Tfp pilus assembly protein PilX
MSFTAGSRRAQRGATLIVGLILIAVISLVVVSAFTMSSTNLKSVSNMQVREEAVAAANEAVEQLISTNFVTALGSQTIKIDINKDGTDDYNVAVATPVCIRSAVMGSLAPGMRNDPLLMGGSVWSTDWDIKASVTDLASGAAVTVHQGVRVSNMTTDEKNAACPD